MVKNLFKFLAIISRSLNTCSHTLALCFIAGAGAGCAGYNHEMQEVYSPYMARDYDRALTKIEASPLVKSKTNRLLYLFEKSMILDRAGQLKESRPLLLQSSELADRLRTVSISATAASFVMNDASQEYGGEDYEKVAIHILLALSFIEDNDFKAAAVEARKINTKLAEINSTYDKNPNRYKEDALGRYLAGAIHEHHGNWDAAIIDYRKALELYQSDYPTFFATRAPEQVQEALARLAVTRQRRDLITKLNLPENTKPLSNDEGEVLFAFERGLISRKQQNDFTIPVGGQIVRFSFPIISPKSWPITEDTGVQVGGNFYPAELMQNMDMIAARTLEDRRTRMIVKQGARLVLKGQAAELARQKFGELAGLAVNLAGAATETADTRSWGTLPSAFYAARVRLSAGKVIKSIKFGGVTKEITPITVKPKSLQIVRIK